MSYECRYRFESPEESQRNEMDGRGMILPLLILLYRRRCSSIVEMEEEGDVLKLLPGRILSFPTSSSCPNGKYSFRIIILVQCEGLGHL